MKKIICFVILFWTSLHFGQYRNIVASQMHSQFIEADTYLGEDTMGHQYFIKNNALFKLKGSEKWQYKNISLGKITAVDVLNPLRILVFYEAFNTLIALDNQLNEVQKTNFNELTTPIITTAMGTASQNNYWLFNQNNQQLVLYNYIHQTIQNIGLFFEQPIKTYHTQFNYFYWVDSLNRYFRCDLFGKKELLAQLPAYDNLYFSEESIVIYQKDDKIFLYDVKKQENISTEISQKSIKSCYYKNQNLAIFTAEGITNYKINLP